MVLFSVIFKSLTQPLLPLALILPVLFSPHPLHYFCNSVTLGRRVFSLAADENTKERTNKPGKKLGALCENSPSWLGGCAVVAACCRLSVCLSVRPSGART